jgi:hypothetical protein
VLDSLKRDVPYVAFGDLHHAVEAMLCRDGFDFAAEVRIGSEELDFLVKPGLGIIATLAYHEPAVERRCRALVESPRVLELLVVTARCRMARLPRTMSGTKVWVLPLLRNSP